MYVTEYNYTLFDDPKLVKQNFIFNMYMNVSFIRNLYTILCFQCRLFFWTTSITFNFELWRPKEENEKHVHHVMKNILRDT